MKIFTYVIFLFLSTKIGLSNEHKQEASFIYDEIDGWQVGVQPSLNYGCYASSPLYERGAMLSIYFNNSNPDDLLLYVHLVNPEWKSLEIGKYYTMGMVFEPFSEEWEGDAQVISYDGYKGIQMEVHPDFLSSFAEMDSIKFLYRDDVLINLSLDGSLNATKSMMECQILVKDSGLDKSSASMKLPKKFQKQKPSTIDPFRN